MGTVWAVDLLEHLAQQFDCAYLSDLRYLSPWEQMRLSREIARVPSETFSLKTWNDALAYLADISPEPDAANATEALTEHLASQYQMARCPLDQQRSIPPIYGIGYVVPTNSKKSEDKT